MQNKDVENKMTHFESNTSTRTVYSRTSFFDVYLARNYISHKYTQI